MGLKASVNGIVDLEAPFLRSREVTSSGNP